MDQSNNELDALFQSYRSAVPDPDPGANFMPGLWRKIESRKTFTIRVRKLTQLFVGAAAALCLFLAMVQVVPSLHDDLSGTYVDILAEAHPAENLSALGIRPAEANTK
jgi:hypothetical protein